MYKLSIYFIEISTFFLIFCFLVKNLKFIVDKYSINKTFLIILTSLKVLFLIFTSLYAKFGFALDSESIYDKSTIYSESLFHSLYHGSFLGSNFLSLLIFPFTKIGQLSYFNLNIIFMLIGLHASLLFYIVLRKHCKTNYQDFLCMTILLYPTLNFFTCYITKDLIIFFLLSYILFLLNFEYKNKNFKIKFILSLLLILLIRPYIFITLATSSIILFIIFYKFKMKDLILFSITSIIISIIIFALFDIKYKQVFASSSENYFMQFFNYLEQRAIVTNIGVAKMNLLNDNIFVKFLHLLFGKSIFSLSFSNIFYFIDKIFLLFVFSHIFFIKININKVEFKNHYIYEYSLLFYSVLLFLLLALSVSNYGIALRLKLMFLPIFFYFIVKNLSTISIKIK